MEVHPNFGMEQMKMVIFLPNGVYFYSVEIDDNEPLFGKIIYMQ